MATLIVVRRDAARTFQHLAATQLGRDLTLPAGGHEPTALPGTPGPPDLARGGGGPGRPRCAALGVPRLCGAPSDTRGLLPEPLASAPQTGGSALPEASRP